MASNAFLKIGDTRTREPCVLKSRWGLTVSMSQRDSHHSAAGLEQLSIDLAKWRKVLRDARTLPLKIMAAVMIEDDVQLLSRILSQGSVDRRVLARGLDLLQPLTPGEYSLRWPLQSHFILGLYAQSRG